MNRLRRLADPAHPASLSSRFRERRLLRLKQLLGTLQRGATVLDVGGYVGFWERAGLLSELQLTVLNLEHPSATPTSVEIVTGDGRDLSRFADASFDLVFSNSVVEHVGRRDDQLLMASEIRRVGRNYFVQTPNYWFPIEPHFLVPGFQWLPLEVRARLVQRFELGHIARMPDANEARQVVAGVQLLDERDVRALFPDAEIWRERFLGLTKSFVASRVQRA